MSEDPRDKIIHDLKGDLAAARRETVERCANIVEDARAKWMREVGPSNSQMVSIAALLMHLDTLVARIRATPQEDA